MSYLTTKEMASIWGVSDRTVCRAAKNGKIPDAILKGNNWLIPKNAQRPVDLRRTTAKETQNSEHDESDFKFPYLVFTEYQYRQRELNNLDKILYDAQILLFQCKFKEAEKKIKFLLSQTRPYSTHYLRIGALHTVIYLSIFLEDPSQIKNYLEEYEEIFKKDFPNKKDLMLGYISIHSSILGSNLIQTSKFETYPFYSRSSLAYLYVLNSRRVMFRSIREPHLTDFSMFIIVRNIIEENGMTIASQSIDCHLAVRYQLIGDLENAKVCLKRALDIAKKTGCFELIVETSQLLERELMDFIQSYDNSLYQKVIRNFKIITKGLMEVSRILFDDSSLSIFTDKDYEIIPYILRGLRNKEIANCINISIDSVSKRISQLFLKTFTQNRKELRAYLLKKMQTKAIL